MQKHKNHIAILLLGGFLFPQVAGSMHYFVISHKFPAEKTNSFTAPEPDFLYHSCLYHFSGFASGILPQDFPELSESNLPPATFNFFSLENYVHENNFNFQLRGPPLRLIFQILFYP